MNWKKFLPVIGIGIFVYILLKLDFSKIIEEVSNANINFLLLAVLFIFITLLTQTIKWLAIARVQKINIPLIESLKVDLISNFYGFITPSRIGSAMRINYLKDYNGG